MVDRSDLFVKERNSSITECAPNEINRTTREKCFRTLEDIKKEHLRTNMLAANNVKDFLEDTNNSQSSEDGKFTTSDASKLEKRLMKQQYLVNNNLFNPTEYFGGLEISDLDDHTTDQRLDDMFLYYLPTEVEEQEDPSPRENQNNQMNKFQHSPPESSKLGDGIKLPGSTIKAGHSKPDLFKSVKDYPQSVKGKAEIVQIGLLSPHPTNQPKVQLNLRKDHTSSYLTKVKTGLKSKVVNQISGSQEMKPVVVVAKSKPNSSNSNKENKGDDRELTSLRNKKSSSVVKTQSSMELKSNRGISELNTMSMIQKSTNTSLQRNNRSSATGSFCNQSSSLNTTTKAHVSSNHKKTDSDHKLIVNQENINLKEELGQAQRLPSTKVETQSTGRSKTKSSDQFQGSQSLRRSGKGRKNFSSFTSTLTTEEEPEFLFKSFNTASRPRTAHSVAIDENNYVLKGILSPTVSKNMMSKGAGDVPKKVQKSTECKPQPINPLKFLNDLLNKRKISSGSSDHLRMPKKPTFLENRIGSPMAQLVTKHTKSTSKGEGTEIKANNQIAKKVQGIATNNNNVGTLNCSKNLFNIKSIDK